MYEHISWEDHPFYLVLNLALSSTKTSRHPLFSDTLEINPSCKHCNPLELIFCQQTLGKK